jgi:hypothetical protein
MVDRVTTSLIDDTVPDPEPIASRWIAARRAGGFGAAMTMSLYLLVKAIWVVAALAGDGLGDHEDPSDWVLLNLVTVAMAIVGVALGLALAQPWGRRLPAVPVLLFSWIASGLLVTVWTYVATSPVLAAFGGPDEVATSSEDVSIAAWEKALITVGVAGMAVGLAIALPIYLRERWPLAFVGHVGDSDPDAPPPSHLASIAVVLTALVGIVGLYWTFGGTLGLDPAQHEDRSRSWYLLTGILAAWALIGALATWTIVRSRAHVRTWVPLTAAAATSGALFAWTGWTSLIGIVGPGDVEHIQTPLVGAVHRSASIVAGLSILGVIVSRYQTARDRGVARA